MLQFFSVTDNEWIRLWMDWFSYNVGELAEWTGVLVSNFLKCRMNFLVKDPEF